MARPSTSRLLARLPDREDIGRSEAIALVAAGLPAADVSELADLLEHELGISVGYLRPDDDLEKLLAPFELGNPFTWIWAAAALEDGKSEINYQLKRRGVRFDWRPKTLRGLFEVWCAKPAA